jgi:hypothetical protein
MPCRRQLLGAQRVRLGAALRSGTRAALPHRVRYLPRGHEQSNHLLGVECYAASLAQSLTANNGGVQQKKPAPSVSFRQSSVRRHDPSSTLDTVDANASTTLPNDDAVVIARAAHGPCRPELRAVHGLHVPIAELANTLR